MRGIVKSIWLRGLFAFLLAVFALPSHAASLGASQFMMGRVAQALPLSPQMPDVSVSFSAKQMEKTCLAVALYHEARGESREGQEAVALVIANRVKSAAYPNTYCGVIYQNAHRKNRCQFSFACDDISDLPQNSEALHSALMIAKLALRNALVVEPLMAKSAHHADDNLMQVTHYHTTAVSPSWGSKLQPIAVIGAHVFYRSERVAKSL